MGSVPLTVVFAAVSIATVTDLRSFRIHNALTLPLLASGLVYHGLMGGSAGLSGSALGALSGIALLMLFYLMGGIGGGDVKLMAGVGAWLGMPMTVGILAVASLAAGLYAVILILVSGRVRETWVNLQIIWHRVATVGRHLGSEDQVEAEVRRSDARRRLVPFAVMIMVGVVTALVISQYQVPH